MPHWGCNLEEPDGPDRFLTIAKRDGVLGLATMAVAAATVDPKSRLATVAAMFGAALLDLDKPFDYFFGLRPFPEVVMKIHQRVQNESDRGMSNEVLYGAALLFADLIQLPQPLASASYFGALAIGSSRGSGLVTLLIASPYQLGSPPDSACQGGLFTDRAMATGKVHPSGLGKPGGVQKNPDLAE